MKPLKHFVLAFLIALAGYIFFYYWIEHLRNRKGPWRVSFTSAPTVTPRVVIDQPWLRITNVQLSFTGTNTSSTNFVTSTFFFRQPRPVPYAVPFGDCIFMDTTFLPGTVTFRLFGHEIELLPRVLMIDHDEYPWRSDTNIVLKPAPPS